MSESEYGLEEEDTNDREREIQEEEQILPEDGEGSKVGQVDEGLIERVGDVAGQGEPLPNEGENKGQEEEDLQVRNMEEGHQANEQDRNKRPDSDVPVIIRKTQPESTFRPDSMYFAERSVREGCQQARSLNRKLKDSQDSEGGFLRNGDDRWARNHNTFSMETRRNISCSFNRRAGICDTCLTGKHSAWIGVGGWELWQSCWRTSTSPRTFRQTGRGNVSGFSGSRTQVCQNLRMNSCCLHLGQVFLRVA
jgi:hypothetical protein